MIRSFPKTWTAALGAILGVTLGLGVMAWGVNSEVHAQTATTTATVRSASPTPPSTGAVASSDSTDSTVFLGLGAAALAGGVGLFAVTRRRS